MKRQRKTLEEFKVVFTKVARKDLNGLDAEIRLNILQAAKHLKTAPFPRGSIIKKFKGIKIPLYRLRAGNFRIVYHIDGKNVAVLFIVDRKDLEKKLKALL
ncbi:MAG: type II toxin-antitoxin system RelE/ParE family toxin [Candidatus Omnitrophota bacterium]|nr:type II toxin-antitoxin system RelE/ParE family toxin [Candidatus Omnitrophota bacterium]